MLKKFGKLRIFMLCFFISMIAWILLGSISIFQIHKSNKQITTFTQISTKPPVDRYNRVYFAITKTNEWTESNDNYLYSYDGLIANTTDKDFRNWCIELKVPDDTVIENTWNCMCFIEENRLYITLPTSSEFEVRSNSEELFGFLLSSKNDLSFRSASISGRMCRKYTSSKLLILCIILASFSALAETYVIVLAYIILRHRQINKRRQEHDNQIIEQTMKTFSNFIDNKDTYTQGHSTRVAAYAREMARRMGMDEQTQLNFFYAGLMHDIGKLTVSDDVLNKTSRLSNDEWSLIQQHTTNGAALLKNFTILPEINDAVLYHHERYDGTGYMNRLSGKDIPLVARIVGIADAYDAMNTNRCYRLKFSEERIISELERCRGKQFDPDLVPYLISMIKDGTIYKL
ncbi:MAG: HD-GYP domain-containing protein [Treponema sp.]|nr:HD-GYP domain-containing protein [Treponema sp.]